MLYNVVLVSAVQPCESAISTHTSLPLGFPGGSVGKESAYNVGDLGLFPRLGRSPGGGYGNPLPVFLPGESPWTKEPAIHGVAKSQT